MSDVQHSGPPGSADQTTLPPSWSLTDLAAVRLDTTCSLDPRKKPGEVFELYSVPQFVEGHPEFCRGCDIGSSKKLLEPQTVLLCKINPRINRVWVVGDHSQYRKIGSTEWIPFSPIDGLDHDYLRYFLSTDEFRNYLASNASGVGGSLMRVRPAVVESYPFKLAPVLEQQRIVEALDSYVSRLDTAQAALERVQANLDRYRASLLQAAVEGRLVPTEAQLAADEGRDYEPADVLLQRILLERRRRWEQAELAKMRAKGKEPKTDTWKSKYKEPVAPDTSELPELPEGWCWATMNQLIWHMTSGSRDWSKFYGKGDAVFIMAQNVRPGRLDRSYVQTVDPPADDASRQRTAIETDDLLVTIVGANAGNVCRVSEPLSEHFVCQSVALMRPVEPRLSTFLDLYLNSPAGCAIYDAFMYGQGRPHLSFEDLRETGVPLPPLGEANRIGEYVARTATQHMSVGQITAMRTVKIAALRQAVLKWAFEGKLVDQNPNDEPASVLLERIRAERAANPPKRPRHRRKAAAT